MHSTDLKKRKKKNLYDKIAAVNESKSEKATLRLHVNKRKEEMNYLKNKSQGGKQLPSKA